MSARAPSRLLRRLALLSLLVRDLRAHAARFALSSLGIAVAVALVLSTRGVFNGLARLVERQFEQFGTRKVYLTQVPWGGELPLEEYLKRPRLDAPLARAVARLPFVSVAAPYYEERARLERGALVFDDLEVVGTRADYLEAEGYAVAAGRFLSARDDETAARVMVLGARVSERLGPASARAAEVLLNGRLFRVIGRLEPRGEVLGESLDDAVYVPASVFETLFGARRSLSVVLHVRAGVAVEAAHDELRARLRHLRGLRDGQPDDFALNSSARLFRDYQDVSAMAQRVVLVIGLLVLVVSGVGISNVMLASVRERAYEIGVKKAVGAAAGDVFFEVLGEVVLMCVASGALGLLAGLALAVLVTLLSPLSAGLGLGDAAFGLLAPAAVALVFGSLPAVIAARVPPARLMAA